MQGGRNEGEAEAETVHLGDGSRVELGVDEGEEEGTRCCWKEAGGGMEGDGVVKWEWGAGAGVDADAAERLKEEGKRRGDRCGMERQRAEAR